MKNIYSRAIYEKKKKKLNIHVNLLKHVNMVFMRNAYKYGGRDSGSMKNYSVYIEF